MKRLILMRIFLLFLFSGSLDSFSQVLDTTYKIDFSKWGSPLTTRVPDTVWFNGKYYGVIKDNHIEYFSVPDTIRAIILVTTSANGFGRSRMGYVVIEIGKEVVYLDCRKRPLKLPQVGWGYRSIEPNYKQR